MADIVNSFFKEHYNAPASERRTFFVYPRMECVDGFTMSVQGHYGAYCTPRIDAADHYSKVEVGYPSEAEDLLMPYAEEADRPTETVYGYVPITVIEQVIERHGGLKGAVVQ